LSLHRQSKGGRPNIRDQPRNEDSNAATSTEERAPKDSYHRRAAVACCIMPGEMDDGGLAMRVPVDGLTIGMALVRERSADG